MRKKVGFQRLVAFLVIAALSVSCTVCMAGSALAATPVDEALVATGDLPSTAISAQVVQSALYVLAEGKLLRYQAASSAPETVIDFTSDPEILWAELILASDGSKLFALSPGQGILYEVCDGALQEAVRLDVSELGQARSDGLRYVIFDHPVVASDYLYLLSIDPETYGDKELLRFSMNDGKCQKLETGSRSLSEIAPYQAGRLVAVDYNTMELVSLDADSGAISQAFGSFGGYSDGAVAYDPGLDRLYFIHGTELMSLSAQKTEATDYLPFDGAVGATYAGIWNDSYVVLADTGLFSCGTTASPTNGDTLTIWYAPNSFPDSELLTKFMLQNPGTAIVSRGTGDDDPLEMLTNASMAMDGSIDIFVVPSYLIDSQEIFERGYAAPLNAETLVSDVRTMYPQMQSYLMRDGVLFGYPAIIYPDYWTVRPELLAEMGLTDIPQTFDEYLDVMLAWYDENYASHPSETFDGSATVQDQWLQTVDLLLMQYIRANAPEDGPLTFDTPAFRRALEKLATLRQWKRETFSGAGSDDALRTLSVFSSNAASPFAQSVNPESQGEVFITPPTFTQEASPVISASMEYFIINPSSTHQDAAMKFLEFYSQNMELDLKYMFHPDLNELVERSTYQTAVQWHTDSVADYNSRIAALEAEDQAASAAGRPTAHDMDLRLLREELAAEEAAFAKEERWEISAETLAQYRQLAPSISFENGALVWGVVETLGARDILTRYFEETASLDQVLQELDRRVAMMYYEGQ